MPESLDVLIDRLDLILTDLRSAEVAHRAEIAAVAPGHRKGAANLVHYTALRQHDLRDLQNDLMDLGATSLATAEANIHAKVLAARNVLAALRGDPGPWHLGSIDEALDEGDEILDAHALALFGTQRPGRPTRIMVTMPAEAADDPALVADFVEAGMDVARINCAHDGPSQWERMIDHIQAAAAAEDASYLPFVAAHADLVAVSFVRSVADIDLVIKALDDVGSDQLGLLLSEVQRKSRTLMRRIHSWDGQ